MEIKSLKAAERFSNDKMQKVNLVETANLFADIYCLESGQEQKVHAHAGADKIYCVLEGTGRFYIGGDEQEINANHLVLAPADVEHGVRNASSERLVLLVMMAPNPNVKG
ncbi:MAG: cupin domain-containing protein [Acidobacteria bacterium]|nr:cupin domain-containing protein [Acidobacteriota bacterium]